MDLLVRALFALREGVRRAAGTLVAVAVAGVLVGEAAEPSGWGGPATFVALGASAGLAGARLVRRLRQLDDGESARLDFELFVHLGLLLHLALLAAPGGLEGPWAPVVYLLAMLAAAFSQPLATVAFLLAMAAVTLLIHRYAFGRSDLTVALPHVGLLAAFGCLNLLVHRLEIARIRALSRARIDSEIAKMKEAARSYRLVGAPAAPPSVARTPAPPQFDHDRLLRSGVEEIHQAMQFALDLVRRALGADSAVLLWSHGRAGDLRVQEASTSVGELSRGPFPAGDGLLAAALQRGGPVALAGRAVARHVPYYPVPRCVGSVAAAPVLEHGAARGVLMVDRSAQREFDASEQDLLVEATRFLLRTMENERVFLQLDRARSEQSKLYRAAERLARVSTEAEVLEAGVASAREIASFDLAMVTLFERDSREHEIVAASGQGMEALVGRRFRHGAGLVSMVVQNRHPLPWRGDYDAARQTLFSRGLPGPAVPALLVLPLTVQERALGTLILGSTRRGALGDSVRPLLELLASHVAVSLAHARMVARLEDLATTDGLTGLLNKRALLEQAERKLRAAERFKKPLSVLVTDIDFFKKVNDEYGHDVGDQVIRGFGALLARVKRDTDLVGRFGGEEFVLVCEETDARGATLLAERVRGELEATTFRTARGPLRVTCSVGVATTASSGHAWEPLFKATDEALYQSKRGGRNRVTLWSPRLSEAKAEGTAA